MPPQTPLERDVARRRRLRGHSLLIELALLACAGGLLLLGGCGESTTSPPQPALSSILTGTDGRQVLWSTDLPTRGAVRYGFVSGQYDRLAYPAAARSADRAYTTEHAVPLLQAVAGVPIYIQRTDRTRQGDLYAAAEETLLFDAVPAAGPFLRMTSLDVQFGDSHVLQLPSEDRVVMIDAGNPYVRRTGETAPAHIKRWLDDQAVTRIDVALATHIHADHYGGFLYAADATNNGILDLYDIGAWLDVPEVSGNQSAYQNLLATVVAKGIARYVIEPGMTDQTDPDALAWDPVVEVTVLNAGSQPEWDGLYGDINNDSICLKISYGEVDILTGGDGEAAAEARMLSRFQGHLAGIEYFKAFHHGRNDENSRSFLQVIAPRVTVIPIAFVAYDQGPSAGYNETAATMGRLAAVGSDIFRYDAAEPIGYANDNQTFWHTTLVTDGTSYEIYIEPSVWGL